MGFYRDKNSYLRDSWNRLDFAVVLFSIADLIIGNLDATSISFLKALRALRALRPLRIVTKS